MLKTGVTFSAFPAGEDSPYCPKKRTATTAERAFFGAASSGESVKPVHLKDLCSRKTLNFSPFSDLTVNIQIRI
jgi:hypothetical protein